MNEQVREPRRGLRALTRASVREQVADQALTLFDERGFEATTVDDIASSVGISARSFFRYFPAKEDVVIADLLPLGARVRDTAAARPADEPVWMVLRRAFDVIDLTSEAEVTRNLKIMRVMMSTASLRARNLEKHIAWAAMLEPVIWERLDGTDDTRRFEAQTLIHCALACLDVALTEWARRDGTTPITELLDQTFTTTRT